MCKKQTTTEITIFYPQRPGFIMEAHNLRQKFVSRFGLTVSLEEGGDDCFTVVLNGTNIYSQSMEGNVHIDHQKIFNVIGKFRKPLPLKPEISSESNNDPDPDHLRWLNSACSGE